MRVAFPLSSFLVAFPPHHLVIASSLPSHPFQQALFLFFVFSLSSYRPHPHEGRRSRSDIYLEFDFAFAVRTFVSCQLCAFVFLVLSSLFRGLVLCAARRSFAVWRPRLFAAFRSDRSRLVLNFTCSTKNNVTSSSPRHSASPSACHLDFAWTACCAQLCVFGVFILLISPSFDSFPAAARMRIQPLVCVLFPLPQPLPPFAPALMLDSRCNTFAEEFELTQQS